MPVDFERIDLINTKENGEMLTSESFKYAARVIHYDLGLKFHYHMLRHTHATKLIEAGVNIKTVQERLRHKNYETTANTYVHNTEKMKNDAVEIFEKAIK